MSRVRVLAGHHLGHATYTCVLPSQSSTGQGAVTLFGWKGNHKVTEDLAETAGFMTKSAEG